jgi:hypothetical protein
LPESHATTRLAVIALAASTARSTGVSTRNGRGGRDTRHVDPIETIIGV